MNQLERITSFQKFQNTLASLELVPDYARYKPKINLEILTSRRLDTMLLLTYLIFAACLAGSIAVHKLIASVTETDTSPRSYSLQNITNIQNRLIYMTNFTVIQPKLVLLFEMKVTQNDFTSLLGWDYGSQPNVCSTVSLKYFSYLWACFNSNGVCKKYISDTTFEQSSKKWLLVQSNPPQTFTTDMCTLKAQKTVSLEIIPLLYHVQVSTMFIFYAIKFK